MATFTIPKPVETNPSTSNRDLSCSRKTSFAPGCLVPILIKDLLPGDKITIRLQSLIESMPMLAPAMDGYKAQFDFYVEPWSNLYGWMDNNKRLDTEQYLTRKRHTFKYGFDVAELQGTELVENGQIKPGSLLNYLGLPVGYIGDNDDPNGGLNAGTFNAEGFLSVLDIYRTYYVNPQEKRGAFVGSVQQGGSTGSIVYYDLETLDNLFQYIRMFDDGVDIGETPFNDILGNGVNQKMEDIDRMLNDFLSGRDGSLKGLPLRTFRMDLMRGLLNSEVGFLKSYVSTERNQFSIDTLRFANKMQKAIDNIDLSGGRFADMMRARWGTKVSSKLDVPFYLGSFSNYFGNVDVINTAAGETDIDGTSIKSVPGQQTGFAAGRVDRDRPISFYTPNYGTLVVMFSLVPIVNYSSGIERDLRKTTFADCYSPEFSQLGYQDVMLSELTALPHMSFLSTPESVIFDSLFDMVVGKQFAWSEYTAWLGRNYGLFGQGQSLDYWVFNRDYQSDALFNSSAGFTDADKAILRPYGSIDTTTYIKPWNWNFLFADNAPYAQNFRLRCNFDVKARRQIPKRMRGHL